MKWVLDGCAGLVTCSGHVKVLTGDGALDQLFPDHHCSGVAESRSNRLCTGAEVRPLPYSQQRVLNRSAHRWLGLSVSTHVQMPRHLRLASGGIYPVGGRR